MNRPTAQTDDRIAEAFRRWGYLQARLDPFGRLPAQPHPELDGLPDHPMRAVYCGPLAVEFLHLPDPERVRWIADRMEAPPPAPDRGRILDRLIRAEILERALQARYGGTRRYSLEGLTALIPLLDEALEAAAERGAKQVMIGMSHRGRLNVMVHTVGKRPRDVFVGFEDVDPRSVLGGGDVKYHLGANGDAVTRTGRALRVFLSSNPSHLEAVDPVVMGRARAKQERDGPGTLLPVSLHGDAAFAGQGILAETLNLADLPDYTVGGTVRLVLNNLIGFTTPPSALHSSRVSTDAAKRLPIPIFHVNGEEPEAVVRAARLAVEYRFTFHSDVVIDLLGYRRHGHSEVEDPTTTQPQLYRRIQAHPPLWASYAERLGIDAEPQSQEARREMEAELDAAREMTTVPMLFDLPAYWSPYRGGPYERSFEVGTGARHELLAEVAEGLAAVPKGFALHPKIAKLLEQRRAMGRGERPVDWGTAEALAFGTLLREGTRVRLSGQDTRRGTFNQRHAVLIDVETEAEHVPLAHLHPRQARFDGVDSPLSEAAPLGYEFGFSRDYPEALVLWEAQFGDFVNGAQIIIDQFVAAAEDKWGLLSGLVLLLPHAYEGQGPEHSSSRLERFLQLAAEDNLQVCQPTTAAQYFHLLRRQAMRKWRKPLVVLTPKSLLRHPAAASPLEEFTGGMFRTLLGDDRPAAERILFCTGKIAHELRAEREKRQDPATAIIALEQIYPFPAEEVAAELERHAAARECVWVQEEPANMGALAYVLPRLEPLTGGRSVRTVKRSASASPATGSGKAHALEQASLIALAFARGS